jgi:5-methylcytosine-specific restriction endonuclease McrA
VTFTQITCPACASILLVQANTPSGALGTCSFCAALIEVVVHPTPPCGNLASTASRDRGRRPPVRKPDITLRDVVVGAGVVGGVLAGAIAIYKGWQAVADDVFETVEFPASFRHELIADHLAERGSWCPSCNEAVEEHQLSVDHIVAVNNGGLTSRANAAVLCRSCNSAKGARNSTLDYLIGRCG